MYKPIFKLYIVLKCLFHHKSALLVAVNKKLIIKQLWKVQKVIISLYWGFFRPFSCCLELIESASKQTKVLLINNKNKEGANFAQLKFLNSTLLWKSNFDRYLSNMCNKKPRMAVSLRMKQNRVRVVSPKLLDCHILLEQTTQRLVEQHAVVRFRLHFSVFHLTFDEGFLHYKDPILFLTMIFSPGMNRRMLGNFYFCSRQTYS